MCCGRGVQFGMLPYYGNLGLLCKVYCVCVSILENQSKLIQLDRLNLESQDL